MWKSKQLIFLFIENGFKMFCIITKEQQHIKLLVISPKPKVGSYSKSCCGSFGIKEVFLMKFATLK